MQTPVAIVDANIERCPARTRGATRAAAEAFIDYLFTPAAQAEFEAVGFRRACPNPNPEAETVLRLWGSGTPAIASRSPPRRAAVPGTVAAPCHECAQPRSQAEGVRQRWPLRPVLGAFVSAHVRIDGVSRVPP